MLDVMLPKNTENFFITFFRYLWPFLLRLICSLELSTRRVSMWSTPNCGRICGQKRFPGWGDENHHPGSGSVLCYVLVGL